MNLYRVTSNQTHLEKGSVFVGDPALWSPHHIFVRELIFGYCKRGAEKFAYVFYDDVEELTNEME